MAHELETHSISLNGKATDVPEGITIDQFLDARSLQGKLVVVEINGEIVPRSNFDSRRFRPGDIVEVVHFVGGG